MERLEHVNRIDDDDDDDDDDDVDRCDVMMLIDVILKV